MKSVTARYRREEDGAWIATSPEIPGYVAHGDSYAEARDRMREGLPWFAEQDLLIAHVVLPEEAEAPATAGPRVSFDINRAPTPSYRAIIDPREPSVANPS
jgi:predicted RNase H-like HicB family nuclease